MTSRITPFQLEVARGFFSLPESDGFFVAGGLALIVNGIVDRDTEDLDAFTSRADVGAAAQALAEFALSRGWGVDMTVMSDGFARLHVSDGPDREVVVELARDSEPLSTTHITVLGPTLSIEDSVGNKVLALFGRAEPRDFTDVCDAAHRFSKPRLLELASERDAGFDPSIFAQMIALIDRMDDRELPYSADRLPALRAFFAEWRAELSNHDDPLTH